MRHHFFYGCTKELESTTSAPPPPVIVSGEKKITSFALLKKDNPSLDFEQREILNECP